MGKYLNEIDYSGLALGGEDGGIYAADSEVVTGAKCHVIEILEDTATFTVLTAKNRGNATVNMLTGVNLYAGVAWPVGSLIYAPSGGYITAFTCDKATRRFTMQDSTAVKNQA